MQESKILESRGGSEVHDACRESRVYPRCVPESVSGVDVRESKIQFVVDAVYAFAHALDRMIADFCGHVRSRRARRRCLRGLDGQDLYTNYLLNVSFDGKQSPTDPRVGCVRTNCPPSRASQTAISNAKSRKHCLPSFGPHQCSRRVVWRDFFRPAHGRIKTKSLKSGLMLQQ